MSNYPYIQLPVTVRWSAPYLLGCDNDQNTCHNAHENIAVDWRQLSKSRDPEELGAVAELAMYQASKSFIHALTAKIQQELYVVATDAQKTADNFWYMNKKMRTTGDPKKQGFFGTRARLVGNTLDAHWYKNRFIVNKGSSNKRVLSDHVAKGKGFRYPATVFKTAKAWEKDAIKVVEARYELLRKRSAALSKIRRAVAEYERLLNQCFPEP